MTGEELSTRLLVGVVLSQMIISGILFLWQESMEYDLYLYNTLRLGRFILVYFAFSVIFNHLDGKSINEIGLRLNRQDIVSNVGLGVTLYVFAGIVFIRYSIFAQGWGLLGKNELAYALLTAGIMAAITDFWTRGFILFQLKARYSTQVAIFGQNLVWFTVHIYEILLISEYISILGAVMLTLFLGIVGDLIAICTRSVVGLMLGHVVLNCMIAGSAQGLF